LREHGVPPGLPEFAFALGDVVVLAHAPSVFNFERMVVVAVSSESDAGAMKRATDILQTAAGFALIARARSFGDAENGNYKSVFKKKDEPIIAGVW
jgi:hypothetical protein